MINAEEVLKEIELRPDMTVADFGCGSGGFTIPLAKKITEGLVYGIDVQSAPLSALKSRSRFENVVNINLTRGDLEKPKGSTLSDSSVDLVVIINTLFQVEDKKAVLAEAKRVLKSAGKLLIVDWYSAAEQGPKTGRITPAFVKKIGEENGFKLEKEFEAGKYNFGMVLANP